MLSPADLSEAIAAYTCGEVSLDQFADWFSAASRCMFGESEAVLEVCLAIEAAFSRLLFEHISEREFREELANAIRPFEIHRRAPKMYIVGDRKHNEQLTAAHVRSFSWSEPGEQACHVVARMSARSEVRLAHGTSTTQELFPLAAAQTA